LEQEKANRRALEQLVTLIENLFVSTKGMVERLNEQNNFFIETTQSNK
jgi:hypothetical protein